jgi:GT2 family glycosyltransferase
MPRAAGVGVSCASAGLGGAGAVGAEEAATAATPASPAASATALTAVDRQPAAEHAEPARYPDVDVVVPTRDRPELLRLTIDSVLAQDYSGVVRVVVVFDQSEPDLTLVRADPHRPVLVVSNGRRPGLAGSRNSGILASRGELVAFCDDDDVWLPGKLSAQVTMMRSDPTAAVVSCGIRIDYDGTLVDRVLPTTTVQLRDLLRDRLTELHPSTFLMRRSAVLEGFGLVDEAVPGSFGEDYEFLLRAARTGPVRTVPEVGVVVRWHKQSYFTSRWETMAQGLSWLLERYPEFASVRAGEARVAGQVAFATAAHGDRRGSLRWVRRTVGRNPLEPRAYLALAVASGVVKPDSIVRRLHDRGRGI